MQSKVLLNHESLLISLLTSSLLREGRHIASILASPLRRGRRSYPSFFNLFLTFFSFLINIILTTFHIFIFFIFTRGGKGFIGHTRCRFLLGLHSFVLNQLGDVNTKSIVGRLSLDKLHHIQSIDRGFLGKNALIHFPVNEVHDINGFNLSFLAFSKDFMRVGK
jgi:hypothetical protein